MSKGGRRRKKGQHRLENGRISESKASQANKERLAREAAMSVAIAARMRHYGVSKTAAKRSTTGYGLGRLMDAGVSDAKSGISRDQHDAALKYAQIKTEYLRSIDPPRGAKAINLNPMPGRDTGLEDEARRIKKVQRATAAYMAALGVIKSTDVLGEQAINMALDERPLNEKHLGALRIVLNALSRHFRGQLDR